MADRHDGTGLIPVVTGARLRVFGCRYREEIALLRFRHGITSDAWGGKANVDGVIGPKLQHRHVLFGGRTTVPEAILNGLRTRTQCGGRDATR